jgi:uncharacterized integral membrane protein
MVESTTPNVPQTGWRPNGRQITIGILVLIVAIFGAVNFEKARIDFLIKTVSVQLVFVIAGCALLGFLAGFLFARHLEKKD